MKLYQLLSIVVIYVHRMAEEAGSALAVEVMDEDRDCSSQPRDLRVWANLKFEEHCTTRQFAVTEFTICRLFQGR